MCVGWNDYIVPPAFNAESIFHRTLECGGGECLCDIKSSKDERASENQAGISR